MEFISVPDIATGGTVVYRRGWHRRTDATHNTKSSLLGAYRLPLTSSNDTRCCDVNTNGRLSHDVTGPSRTSGLFTLIKCELVVKKTVLLKELPH